MRFATLLVLLMVLTRLAQADFELPPLGWHPASKGLCDILDISSCPAGEGCYISLASGSSTCSQPFESRQQNEACEFLNHCAIGLGCVLNNTSGTGLLCAHYCDPATGVTATEQQCGDVPAIAGGMPRCVAFSEFYGDVSAEGGMCVNCDDYPESIPCDRLFRDGFESLAN